VTFGRNDGSSSLGCLLRVAAGGLVCLVLLFSMAPPASAALGESAVSIEADRQTLNGALQSVTAAGYSVAQIDSAAGIRVKEYLSPAGEVFGVSWQGPTPPDLRALLGAHFGELQEALKTGHRPRRAVVIRTERMVIEMAGHARSFHGRAYLPALLPDALSPTVVR